MLGNYHSESKAKNFLNYQENQETYEHTTMVNGLVLRKKKFLVNKMHTSWYYTLFRAYLIKIKTLKLFIYTLF